MLINIQVITNEWIDIVILDNINNNAKRLSNNDCGEYIIENELLKINWINWGLEIFTKNDNIYYNIKNNIFEINLENNEWNDIGIFNSNDKTIVRKYYESEIGNYEFKENILTINWKNWGLETFYQLKFGKYYVNTNFGNLIKNNKKIIKIIAIVFPQFHEIPENNEFWGNNFTEWTLLSKMPRIVNGEIIKQPHSDIGYFNLKDYNHRKYMRILADNYNIYGFCYYHYWFKNKKVMYEPTELMLIDNEPNKPFFFCWANEAWTRRWDGGNNEILIDQDYGDEDSNILHFFYLLQFFKHKNYIKKFNKPIFIFYRIEENDKIHISNIIKLWNKLALKEGFNGIHFMRFLGPFNNNIEVENIDGYVQFSPGYFTSKYFDEIISEDTNKIFEDYDENKYLLKNPDIKDLVINNTFFSGLDHYSIIGLKEKKFRTSKFFVYDGLKLYEKILQNFKNYEEEHRGISLNWNNTPRKNFTNEEYDKYPHYYKNINAELFGNTFYKLLEKIDNEPNNHDEFLFISAWNEWNEQAILEPNNEDGYNYLINLNSNYLKFYNYPKKNFNILSISHYGGGTSKYTFDLKNIFLNYNFIDFDVFENNIDYDTIYKDINIVHINSILFNNLKNNIFYLLKNFFKNAKIYLTIHDYQWIYFDEPNIIKEDFLKTNYDINNINEFNKLLEITSKIIFPSINIYNNYNKVINLSNFNNKIYIINHNDKIINHNFLVIPIIKNNINISFIGNFTYYKGSNLFLELTEKYKTFNNLNIKYHIFGSCNYENNNNLINHNYYDDNNIIEELHKNNIHGILHLSIFEESYCYALTNSINSGIPIFYINHGAINERLILKDKYFPSSLEDIEKNYELFLDYIIKNNNVCDFYKLNDTIQPNRWYLENYN